MLEYKCAASEAQEADRLRGEEYQRHDWHRTLEESEGPERPLNDVIVELITLPIADLRDQWRAAHPTLTMPDKLPRDLLVRSIVWSIQSEQRGGLSSAAERSLDKMSRQLATTGSLELDRTVRPKPGTRLIREWRGKTYVVEVGDDGFTHDEETYSSLSHVARAITGTRWSGPRFFGLRPEDAEQSADGAAGGRR